jgi:CubicO group peptidase (beta-lactamase class C family)
MRLPPLSRTLFIACFVLINVSMMMYALIVLGSREMLARVYHVNRRTLAAACVALVVVSLVLAVVYRAEFARVYHVIRLFDAEIIVSNFRSMDTMFGTAPVRRGPVAHQFERSIRNLPLTYVYKGQTKKVSDFMEQTWTTGMVVLQDGAVVSENYYRGNTASSKVISWSVAKSFISALVGIAVEEGHIKDINQPVTDYVPALRGSGYNGVSIKNVLQMSSGIRFNEDYGDFCSDINRLGRALAFNTSLDDFVASLLRRKRTPGTFHDYVSMDTQVLGMVLRAATGETLASYLESRVWQKLGMESDAYWLIDRKRMELAFGGLNAVLRDYARFGHLYLSEGKWQGKQVVPVSWVRASVTPDAPHLQPGNPNSSWVLGYGYQWWIPQQPDGDFLAIGVYNQFIYVDPKRKIVIAKSSAYPAYNEDGQEKELETIAVFRAIAKQVATVARGLD